MCLMPIYKPAFEVRGMSYVAQVWVSEQIKKGYIIKLGLDKAWGTSGAGINLLSLIVVK